MDKGKTYMFGSSGPVDGTRGQEQGSALALLGRDLGTAALYFLDCAVFGVAALLQANSAVRTLFAVAGACFLVSGTGFLRTGLEARRNRKGSARRSTGKT